MIPHTATAKLVLAFSHRTSKHLLLAIGTKKGERQKGVGVVHYNIAPVSQRCTIVVGISSVLRDYKESACSIVPLRRKNRECPEDVKSYARVPATRDEEGGARAL